MEPMPSIMRRKSIRNALQGFLGTYTSRNSDLGGYWLFGQLLVRKPSYQFSLMGWACHTNPIEETAWRLAISRFTDQVRKAKLSLKIVRQAVLEIDTNPEQVTGMRSGKTTSGHLVTVTIRCLLDNGQSYENQRTFFVAPHDPAYEIKRATNPDSLSP
ncbi:hypothetical protein Psta_2681 [Pirellula staleyi DSM 6068]|uniref:Uncharacterized protein n=1 Tax=Pirellula staleyi (strain ATCC 27377 / DSM 6068 / ICPB 4128) TaxID=530564 RepID=D2R6Q0_PIRSD|nr:hypothetical protein Psta_2681 [Pirellula staleyi DSM 6068]